MPHVIAWCGFLGAWLLVAGPLDQAVREIEEAGFEHEVLEAAKAHVEEPPPVSRWWLVLPPLNAWLYVAVGAALIAVKEIWELHEAYDWPEWTFFLGIVGMVVFCVSITVGRTRRRHHRPAVEG